MSANQVPLTGAQNETMAKAVYEALRTQQQQQQQQQQQVGHYRSPTLSASLPSSSKPTAMSNANNTIQIRNELHNLMLARQLRAPEAPPFSAPSQPPASLSSLSEAYTQALANNRLPPTTGAPLAASAPTPGNDLLNKVNDIKTLLSLLTQPNVSNQMPPEKRALATLLLQNAVRDMGLGPLLTSSSPVVAAAPTHQDLSSLALNMLAQEAGPKPQQYAAANWALSNSLAGQQQHQIPSQTFSGLSPVTQPSGLAEVLQQVLAKERATAAAGLESSSKLSAQTAAEPGGDQKPSYITRESVGPFPQKLYQILGFLKDDGKEDLASFSEDGQSFQIHKVEEFVQQILPSHFRMTTLASFQRQLSFYKFHRCHCTSVKGIAYMHPKFQGGKADLVNQMRRVKRPSSSSKKQSVGDDKAKNCVKPSPVMSLGASN